MDEAHFSAFVDILKFLKAEEARNAHLGDTIVTLLSVFHKYFTPGQAGIIEKEFGQYEKRRLEHAIPEKEPEINLKAPKPDDFPPPEKPKPDWF